MDELNLRHYAVVAKDCCHLDSLYNDLETPGGTDCIPEREVHCFKRCPCLSVTGYLLTPEEANIISNDERISYVENTDSIEFTQIVEHLEISSSNFDKGAAQNVNHINWAFLRCVEGQNRYGWGADGYANQTGIVTTTSTGKNVDVVILDGAIHYDHPEFAVNSDGTGGSRVVLYNWFQNKGNYGIPNSFADEYDYDARRDHPQNSDHSTHVAGTVAGNTQGWARDANIYSLDVYNRTGTSSSNLEDFCALIKAFHLTKPINPETGRKNPTIVNASIGTIATLSKLVTPATYDGRVYDSEFESVTYRGETIEGPLTYQQYDDVGMVMDENYSSGGLFNQGYIVFPTNLDTFGRIALKDLIKSGVLFCASAGNDKLKIARDKSDPDFENTYDNGYYLRSTPIGELPDTVFGGLSYHRGTTICNPASYLDEWTSNPSVQHRSYYDNKPIVVGASNSSVVDAKRSFSTCGPAVDVFGPGTNIQSAAALDEYDAVEDPRNTNFYLRKQNGTSMSCPQVTGLLACALENYPNMTQEQAHQYIRKYWKYNQYLDTGGGYTDENSLQGGENIYPFYYKERKLDGNMIPKVEQWIRPSSGNVWPRRPLTTYGRD